MAVRRPRHGEKTGARWEARLGDSEIVGSPGQANRDWGQVDEVVGLGRGCGEKARASGALDFVRGEPPARL